MLKVMRDVLKSHIYIYIYIGVLLAGLFLATNFGFISSVSAANPSSVDYNVYIKPSLSISASTNTVSINLNPNSSPFGTANLNVTVGTNNQYGYKLFMNSTNSIGDNDTNLVRNDSLDGVITNATIPTLSSTTTQSSFPSNKWGYRLNNNNVGGDSGITDTTATNFYPYANTPNPPVISSSNSATNEQTANLTFGAKIDYTKPAGQYDLTLKFKALPIVSTYYMQDIAADSTLATSVCTEEPTVVLDKRDEQSYTIRRINGDCWMVENLKFTGNELDSTTSNVAPNYTPSNPCIMNNGNGWADLTDGNSFTEARMHVGTIASGMSPIDGDDTVQSNIPTVWYNYAGASAGTITESDNSNPQLYDICPAGWRLPNDVEINSVLSNISEFSPVIGGVWRSSTLQNTELSNWYGSNTDPARSGYRSLLRYDGSILNAGTVARDYGRYVRCVMGGSNINNLTFMQDFARITESDAATGDNKKQQVIDSMELNSTTGYSLKDTRDINTYTINKIGPANDTSKQNVWMTKNLLFQGTTLNPTDTDVTTTRYINGSGVKAYYNLATQSSSATDYCRDNYTGNSPGYINACTYYTTSDSNIGNIPNAWYNYAAASAGTITGTSNSATATESICPKGWAMPDQLQVESIGNNTSTYIPIFKPVGGGFYDNSVPSLLDRGYYWSRVILDSGVNRYYLGYYSAEPAYLGAWGSTRAGGRYVRCVAK